jgi:hypothetical protein
MVSAMYATSDFAKGFSSSRIRNPIRRMSNFGYTAPAYVCALDILLS